MKINIDELIQRYPRCKKFKQLYEDAMEHGGEILWDDSHIDIIFPNVIETDIFENAGIPAKDVMGLYVRPMDNKISTYLAVSGADGVTPKVLLTDKLTEDDTSANMVIMKSILAANSCSICHKDIPTKDQKVIHYQHYCPDCYAMLMKERQQEQQLGRYGEI